MRLEDVGPEIALDVPLPQAARLARYCLLFGMAPCDVATRLRAEGFPARDAGRAVFAQHAALCN